MESPGSVTDGAARRPPHDRGADAHDGVLGVGLDLAVEHVPGGESIFGRRLQQVRGQHAERLIGPHQEPAGVGGERRGFSPVALHFHRPMPFKQRLQHHGVHRKSLGLAGPGLTEPLDRDPLPPDQRGQVAEPGRQQVGRPGAPHGGTATKRSNTGMRIVR